MTDLSPPRTHQAFIAHVRASAGQFGAAEKRVAEALVSDIDEITTLATSHIARRAQTSAATVVRTCQRLGYSGYNALKAELTRFQYLQASTVDANTPSTDIDAPSTIIDRVFSTAQADLASAVTLLDRESFDRAVDVLSSAQRILFVGSGESATPAQDAALRFTMGGRQAVAPVETLSQQFTARLLSKEDACVAISFSGANRHTLDAVSAARSAGARIISITSSGVSPLAQRADVSLATGSPTQETDVFVGRIAHTLVLNALNLAIQQESGEPAFGPSQDLIDVFARTLRPENPTGLDEPDAQ